MTALPANLTPGVWALDTAHSEFAFTVRHAGVSKVRGHFNVIGGDLTVGEDLASSSVSAKADAASIVTGNEQRDQHIATGDFFDAENNPEISFTSTSLEGSWEDFTLTGDLSIRGVTKQVEFAAEFNGVGDTPMGQTIAGFTATATIKRKDFGINFDVLMGDNTLLVSDKVQIGIEIEAIKPE